MRIVETTIADKIDQATALAEEHWHEVARNKQLMVINLDRDRYQAMEDSGMLLSLVAYDDEDQIIGYSINVVTPHLHYKDVIVAYNDLLFVGKDYRKSSLGLRLIRETKQLAKKRGVHVVAWHAKEGTPLAKILPKMGAPLHEQTFLEVL